jgi:hypothetical protein
MAAPIGRRGPIPSRGLCQGAEAGQSPERVRPPMHQGLTTFHSVVLRRFLIWSASHASHLGCSRSTSQSCLRCPSSSSPDSSARSDFSTRGGGRADWRPCTSPSVSSRKRKRSLNSASMYYITPRLSGFVKKLSPPRNSRVFALRFEGSIPLD